MGLFAAMTDFWGSCGYNLLERNADRRLIVTDVYLRAYYIRPELAPVKESSAHERALHASLLDSPRRAVDDRTIALIEDEDTRENYRVVLRFRDQLLAASSLEAFYSGLFQRDVEVPPLLVDQTVQVILRGILDAAEDGLQARAAELFFRRQRVNTENGAIRLADDETVEMHATSGGLGQLGTLIIKAQTPLRTVELDVLDVETQADYWGRDERFDTVLSLNRSHPGCAAFCRVLEAWVWHFHHTAVAIEPVGEIPDQEWVWHVGLDAEASAMLNRIYTGVEVDTEDMKRIIGLYRMEFKNPSDMRVDLAGKPVFLGLAVTPGNLLRMKPQNLLVNLPLASHA
jgi:hypothetical protein